MTKLDVKDLERYNAVKSEIEKSQGTLNMLKEQIDKSTARHISLQGQFEMLSSIFVEKYELDKTKIYDISKDGIITEKT